MAVMVGMAGAVSHVVTPDDTARALRSGDVDVLGTPRVVAWLEEATMVAVAPGVRESDVCVGTRVHLDHVQPAAVGHRVEATATVTAIDGRIITLEVDLTRHADDGDILLAHGEITRVVLSRQGFVERLG